MYYSNIDIIEVLYKKYDAFEAAYCSEILTNEF